MPTHFANNILDRPDRFAMPIGVYAGLELTGANVRQAVTEAQAQTDAVLALHERFHTEALLTAMDLSAEAETFGCDIRMEDDDIPTVIGRRAATAAEVAALPDPLPGDLRTAVHLETARRLVESGKAPVFGGCIGPFSLAGRIFGVSEALEATVLEPELVLTLLQKVTCFLSGYVGAFRETGAAGVIMAEPAAGLLSPRGLARFSAAFVKQIVEAVQMPDFVIILHNCGAKLAHLPKVLESGAEVYHFGAPMDLPAALAQVDGGVILGGNLDPTAVFHSGTPEQVHRQTQELLEAVRAYPNFFISSGCDIPPGTPIANLDAFYRTVRDFR
ncbi:MAG: methylcobamide--CoM methyltransferase [Anaerolineae bacterium]|nr:methylcobamide--CoM methyltransferase [Anaerolineae bacterium]